MEKLQFECKQYKLYSPDSLKYITDNMHEILLAKIEEYKKIFNIDNFEQLQINLFDDLEKFRSFVNELRGGKDFLPEHARGIFSEEMISAYIEPNIIINSPMYYNRLYLSCHELFHILYEKYILQYDKSKRIVWYDEGMAQYMSGEKDVLINDILFKHFYNKVKADIKRIPNLNKLSSGSNFKCDDYNGYELSYLAIRYLSEVLSENDFISLMSDFEQIKKYGETILNDMFLYYNKKLEGRIYN